MNTALRDRILNDLKSFLETHMDIVEHMPAQELKQFRKDFIVRACDFYKVHPEDVGFLVARGRFAIIREEV